ncbi:hypothetical protein VB711_01080 [Cronbergia sp. UHCC 0137]|uniref:hypothetical protein n=1 Tax=Cronbergia sp. UHCC 0137 TaxID=3110239 RepID=UPI002B1F8A50|nr:hypothetical protein [Cronbergia sp. UHCC 0137]MEA5616437.1 hypothetical protein [Cronbergia sp. UHCC 0137]
MTSLINFQESNLNNTIPAQRLERGIRVSAGEFSLVLACCNSLQRQQQILNLLKESLSTDIQEITLSPETQTLYTTIENVLGDSQPETLMIRGLESVEEINQLIISTNVMRDEFRKNFHFPIVLWINDEILSKLVWLAPDLKNWAASTIRFEVPLIEQRPLSA